MSPPSLPTNNASRSHKRTARVVRSGSVCLRHLRQIGTSHTRTDPHQARLQGPLIAKKQQEKPIAEFDCNISPTTSGFMVGGKAAQVKLEIPGSELPAIVNLVAYAQLKKLRVVVYDHPSND